MSPEQVRAELVDHRTDLFSLGCVLYELLSGRRAFRRDTAAETMTAILREEPAPIASADGEALPPGLARVVARCLAKDPAERFQSARDLAFALSEISSSAALPSPAGSYAATPPASARPTAKRVVPAVAIVLLAGLGALLWLRSGTQGPAAPTGVEAALPRSLAVLPFAEIGESGEKYFGIGLADTLQTKLSAISGLTVRPTSAVRKFAEGPGDPLAAGAELAVDAVLDGSVQRAAGRLRMNLRLLELPSGRALWAESFDLAAGDLFQVQDEIATAVLSRLELHLDPEQAARLRARGTSNPAAYEAYLRGKAELDHGGIDSTLDAMAQFDEAVHLDPAYALAYARRADAAARRGLFTEPDRVEWIERARRDVATAIELDPALSEPHAVLCDIAFSIHGGWDMAAAARHCREAQRLTPNAGIAELGTLYFHLGLVEPALRVLRRALEVDPTSRRAQTSYLSTLEYAGRWEEAVAEYRRLLGPDRPPDYALVWLGRIDEAERSFAKHLADPSLTERERRWARHGNLLVLARRGRHAEATAEIERLAAEVPRRDRSFHHYAHAFAAARALAGDPTGAVRWLREMVATGMPNLPLIERDPNFDPIRETIGYRELVAELRPVWEGYEREFR
jgi:TolB-like protein/Tfp pilus assembly protein PilF